MKRMPRMSGVLCMLLLAGSCTLDRQMHGVMVDPPRDIASFDFTLASGARWSTAPEADRPMMVFFGYTNCPDVCPTTLADWKRAKATLGRDAERVRFVFVSVDPERDTPLLADAYAKRFDPAFIGVSGDTATTARIMKAFGASAAPEASAHSTHYLVSHTASAFLVDAKGRLVAIYPSGIGWEAVAADLADLL